MSDDGDEQDQQFREHVRDAIQAGGKVGAMSRKTGIPIGTLNKYVSLRSAPSAINALKIAKAIGLTVEELAAGKAPQIEENASEDAAGQNAINPAIFKAVKQLVRTINEEAGIRLPDEARDDEAVRRYNDLVALACGSTDEGKLRSLLPALEYEITESVKSAVAEPGTGKRSA